MPVPLPPAWLWPDACSVLLSFAAIPAEKTAFVWVTSPSLPSLFTRMGVFTFDAPICFADESANANCALPADWSLVWIPVEPSWHLQSPAPYWDWSDACFVSLSFFAIAAEPTAFVCVTSPLVPSLPTRTDRLTFFGA